MAPLNRLYAYASVHLPPFRFLFVFGLFFFFLLSTLFYTFSPSISIPLPASVVSLSNSTLQHIPSPHFRPIGIPSIHNPFRPGAHKPPVQANSTSGEASWYNDWAWLNPFSSSITLDEERSVLPPPRNRPRIYTFYDTRKKKDAATQKAEQALLHIWRRAWWAQGFRPVILGREDAMKNPLFEALQLIDNLNPAVEAEAFRWLAWGHMGTGILSHYLALPMASHDAPVLQYLRRGNYPQLTGYKGLDNGLFSGDGASINAALKQVLVNSTLNGAGALIPKFPANLLKIDPKQASVAYYSNEVLSANYKSIGEAILKSPSEGLNLLAKLVNGHLHLTFHNTYPEGISVLKPLPEHTTALILPALQLAQTLASCPDTPSPKSCPPNHLKCSPCSEDSLPISTSPSFLNASSHYTIATIPHPYTRISMAHQRDTLDIHFIRGSVERDPWVYAVTEITLGKAVSASPRVVHLKEAIATEWGKPSSLWLTAEAEMPVPTDLEWHFGFDIANPSALNVTALLQAAGKAGRAEAISEEQYAREAALLEHTRKTVANKARVVQQMRDVTEAWNLADMEAWRFSRAWMARKAVERRKWEEDEHGFMGREGWFD
ncbi:MAG: hypothetical protein M1829_006243 [Trizodia sp. TS-e1964]|nr:MAG: hypothetical protein M1829_006243 [Trizodia sp. TS-e1964]